MSIETSGGAADRSEYSDIHEYDDTEISVLRHKIHDIGLEDDTPEAKRTREQIEKWDKAYRNNIPDGTVNPNIDKHGKLTRYNPIAKKIFSKKKRPALRKWREDLVPTAIALYPLQYPRLDRLPTPEGGKGMEVDAGTKEMFLYSLDAIGIRVRAKIMQDRLEQDVYDQGDVRWLSIACGAGVPVIEALSNLQYQSTTRFHVTMIDMDPNALHFAEHLVREAEFGENVSVNFKESNIYRSIIRADDPASEIFGDQCTEQEKQMDMIDALGIFEYLDDEVAVEILRKSHAMLRTGGKLIFANMLDTHPQRWFNQHGIGWPKIHLRSLNDLLSLVGQAGIPLEEVKINLGNDDIYAVFEIIRSTERSATDGQKSGIGAAACHEVAA